MEDATLKNLWTEYGNQIEESRVLNMQSWTLNLQCREMIQSQKAKSKLRTVFAGRVAGIIIGFIWVWFLGILVYHVNFRNLFFSISVGAIFLFNIITATNTKMEIPITILNTVLSLILFYFFQGYRLRSRLFSHGSYIQPLIL